MRTRRGGRGREKTQKKKEIARVGFEPGRDSPMIKRFAGALNYAVIVAGLTRGVIDVAPRYG